MAVAVFVLGGVLGLIGAIATLALTDAGWGTALMVYFGLGYAVPGVALGVLLIRTSSREPVDKEIPQPPDKARVSRL